MKTKKKFLKDLFIQRCNSVAFKNIDFFSPVVFLNKIKLSL